MSKQTTQEQIEDIVTRLRNIGTEAYNKAYSKYPDDGYKRVTLQMKIEDEIAKELTAKINKLLIEARDISQVCTVDTNSEGVDYIRFFDGSEPCYTITEFWNCLNQANLNNSNKE